MITERQAKKIRIGDKVVFSDGVKGECIEVGFNACKFSWQDGQVGIIHHRDMQDVSFQFDPTKQPKQPMADSAGERHPTK